MSAIPCRNPITPPTPPRLLDTGSDLFTSNPTYPIVKLETVREWMRYCDRCDAETCFRADRECLYGSLGICTHCGEERIAPFTRGNSEAA